MYQKGDQTIGYHITYKRIKHIYFRDGKDHIKITANHQMKESDILKVLDRHFDKLLKMVGRKTKQETAKYQLWGIPLDQDTFYGGVMPTEKNLLSILKHETIKKIEALEPILINDLRKLGLNLVPTKVKKLKTKFGSCQIIKKEITINSFLAKLDPIYLYYVLLHEYCHLIVSNHSKAFYQVLDRVMVDHKKIQKNLRKHVISF